MGHSQAKTRDRLILPDPALAGCLFGSLVRDTSDRRLPAPERFNYFPASPLCSVSWFFEGCSHMVTGGVPDPDPLPRLLFAGPQSAPLTTWNPGVVVALSIGFYPDAWAALGGRGVAPGRDHLCGLEEVLDGPMLDLFLGVGSVGDLGAFETALARLWQSRRASRPDTINRLADWSRALVVRAALSGVGRGCRQVQRRIRGWTGQSRRDLARYAQIETLAQMSANGERDLAGMAQEAGFSDQSHMGRVLKRVTGFSPAALNRAIDRDEALWAYRLMGERF